MTAAEIAAQLTPAQIRALRDLNGKHGSTTLWILWKRHALLADWAPDLLDLTPLGREVLAVIEEAEK